MQTLPYVIVTNPHLSEVYDLYYKAFEAFRRVPEIKTLEDNDKYCKIVSEQLRGHLPIIPNLAMGVLECQGLIDHAEMDRFVNTMLRARISRRTIAEQHLALTETFNSPWHFPDAAVRTDDAEFVGEVFLRCNAKEVVERCGKIAQDLARQAGGPDTAVPEIVVRGHLDATFPYILGHLEYIIGELLRNSIQATCEKYRTSQPRPIEVLVCEAPQHVIIRISDRGGGIPRELMSSLWSFSKGPRSESRLKNLGQVPTMAATMQEMEFALAGDGKSGASTSMSPSADSSLSSLSSRPPHLRLGIGLPMSRVYAEYWAGSLELHSLEGYGVDAFLQISKLGNKNEQVTTRASMDAV